MVMLRISRALTGRALAALPRCPPQLLRAQRQPTRHFRTSAAPLAGQGTHIHRDSVVNSEETPWEWSAESLAKIDMYLKRYPDTAQGKMSGIMPLLWVAQQQTDVAHATLKAIPAYEGALSMDEPQGSGGWVPLSAMNAIAKRLGCPRMAVYEVATFFTMYNRNKQGRFHIQLCATTPCMVCGAYDILAAIEKHLGIKCGETTPDAAFTLTEVECLGACVNAPMVQINDHFYEDLTPQSIVKLLDDLKAGNPVKIGPQNARINSLGPLGRTSLTGTPSGPYCRDLSDPPPAPAA
ncbi:thioredoxin-like [2Fe-2S] ferredoxin-domain-containing protein, partial [Pavlovales sp. CCMP2436]